MNKFRLLVVESVFPRDFYSDNLEGHVVQAIARVLHWDVTYKIALDADRFRQAMKTAAKDRYDILHLSCHGDADGIQLTDETELSWHELAECFQAKAAAPRAVIMSSCAGGNRQISQAFIDCRYRPQVFFGAEGEDDCLITFPGACIAWPVLYATLAKSGLRRAAFRDAVTKMNLITDHEFVYRRWNGTEYLRHPVRSRPSKGKQKRA